MMIIARQLHHYKEQPSYKNWVKATIGEMHYHVKNQTKFTETLESLQNMIFFETDIDVLTIHAQTSIVPPRGMNHLVLEYKQHLRTRIASYSEPEIIMDLT